ncbi:AAA family ATPase [Roseomonas rosulenta]|uniref:AAA family ATPase n=1 Tax=Roseomonas rosulenta TaxID=2748667 RepID=UPI0018DFA5FD|nr:AAA family ATPase [Roseomonas rosulenta]
MPDSFTLNFPLSGGESWNKSLNIGEILFVLGANGAGKSSLVSRFFQSNGKNAKRISAHRQTWFTSNALDITPQTRDNLERNIRAQDQQAHARYQQHYAAERAGVAIYDLIDSDTMLERAIASLVRAGDLAAAEEKAKIPSPLNVINELMRLSNIPIEISLADRQKIVARRNNGDPYSVAELSDGERNGFLIAADVLTAPPNSLLIIDEPERHLHRSIVSPLLTLLFQKRAECAFIVSTHELMLPIDNPGSHSLLVRSCSYRGSELQSWSADLLESQTDVDDDIKRDILGARQKIIFVEGTTQSLDTTLYSLVFPQVSMLPKSSCRDVEHAVRGLREAKELHWVQAWGIVDNDRRSPEDIERLQALGVHALSHFSVESIYFHTKLIHRIAQRQAGVTGEDSRQIFDRAVNDAIEAVKSHREYLIENATTRLVRHDIFSKIPNKEETRNNSSIDIRIDVENIRISEHMMIEKLIQDRDLDGILQRYPLRESPALTRIAAAVGLNRKKYESAVRKLIQDDHEALDFVRSLFGKLLAEVIE